MAKQDTGTDEPITENEENAEISEEDLPEAEIVEEPLEQAERERDEFREKWQRAQADFQNLRRRTLSDTQGAIQRGTGEILHDVIGVLDFLDMALKSPCESADAKALLMGVQMTRDQLWKVLEAQGVSIIAAEGNFDAEVHQAVSTVEEEEAGRIVELVRNGYRRPNDVLRHAQVRVSVLPEPPAEPEAPESTEEPTPEG
ncbi:MAG: molecular chaperone GrpE [Planctomycetota bacterium]|jgi:molecular chaperone GrpE